MDADVAVMTSAGYPAARAACECVVQSSPKLLLACDSAGGSDEADSFLAA